MPQGQLVIGALTPEEARALELAGVDASDVAAVALMGTGIQILDGNDETVVLGVRVRIPRELLTVLAEPSAHAAHMFQVALIMRPYVRLVLRREALGLPDGVHDVPEPRRVVLPGGEH